MAGRLEDKVALVIGAGSSGPGWGNGKATAVRFAQEGAAVMCADIRLAAAEETAGLITADGGRAIAMACDWTKADQVEALAKATLAAFGSIDVLDNNVGIAETGGVADVDESLWERVFAINLKGAYLAMKAVLPIMERQFAEDGRQGSVINISSIASVRYTGVPYVTYAATKAALNQMTKVTAAEYAARGVRVNAILPGLMKTPMVEHSPGLAKAYAEGDIEAMWAKRAEQVPMKRMGDAWDVANAALFLASDEARYITGVELLVDGGITLKCA